MARNLNANWLPLAEGWLMVSRLRHPDPVPGAQTGKPAETGPCLMLEARRGEPRRYLREFEAAYGAGGGLNPRTLQAAHQINRGLHVAA